MFFQDIGHQRRINVIHSARTRQYATIREEIKIIFPCRTYFRFIIVIFRLIFIQPVMREKWMKALFLLGSISESGINERIDMKRNMLIVKSFMQHLDNINIFRRCHNIDAYMIISFQFLDTGEEIFFRNEFPVKTYIQVRLLLYSPVQFCLLRKVRNNSENLVLFGQTVNKINESIIQKRLSTRYIYQGWREFLKCRDPFIRSPFHVSWDNFPIIESRDYWTIRATIVTLKCCPKYNMQAVWK
ncbi:hypothetical protein OPIT5_24115 [Opitutaceae bacterium TAV5]|nr:hypothetical protein OPIT5_24115 [Opitutaceae bacterium TAV5]